MRLAAELVAGFREHGLLIEAGAIAFRAFLALLTGFLFVAGLLGFFELSEVWRDELAPGVEEAVSPPAFRVIDGAVTSVLRDQQVFWVTIGAALAIWQASSVVRATGQVVNRIHGVDGEGPLKKELLSSVVTGAAVAALVVVALAAVRLGPLAFDALLGDGDAVVAVSFVVRWGAAAACLLLAVGLLANWANAIDRPAYAVTLGSVAVVAVWMAVSVAFGLYLTAIASFQSLFGGIATAFLLAEYLFLGAVVLLGGLLLDALRASRPAAAECHAGALNTR